jgi:hypothetical protein
MKLNTINLSNGSRFFIVEDFFGEEQYNSIVGLFDQYTADNADWWEDPVYAHTYHGRCVYRGSSEVVDQINQLATSAATLEWISGLIGKELEFAGSDLWLDLPGYRVTPHYDGTHFEYAVQIYVPDPGPGRSWEMLGTCVYTDANMYRPLFEIHYIANRGYIIDRADTVRHGVNHAIPQQYRRQSVYIRYRQR